MHALDPVTYVDDDYDPPRPMYVTWAGLIGIYSSYPLDKASMTRAEASLCTHEGLWWMRGFVSVRSSEWRAMLTARAL